MLSDNIRQCGDMGKLVSDVKGALHNFLIDSCQSDHHKKYQNPTEGRHQNSKRSTKTLLTRTKAPSFCWLLAMSHIFSCSIKPAIILSKPLLCKFQMDMHATLARYCTLPSRNVFYFSHGDPTFGSNYPEERTPFVGISKNSVHDMTVTMLKDDTQKIVCRSNTHPGDDTFTKNLRVDPATSPSVVKSRHETFTDDDTVLLLLLLFMNMENTKLDLL